VRKKCAAQIVPLLCVLLPFLIVFVGANFHRTLFGLEKIQRQRVVDLLALEGATQQARALNAIAALNEALKIILRRAQAYAGALTALAACASATFFVSPCTPALKRLGKKAPEFFRKVDRLASIIGDWQDELADWASRAPEQAVRLSLLGEIPAAVFGILPDPPRLRIHRRDGLKIFGVPSPYVLDPGFRTLQRLAVTITMPPLAALRGENHPSRILSADRRLPPVSSRPQEAAAEAGISGEDLNHMEFVPELRESGGGSELEALR
jgi:hypothetical protein